MIKLTSNLDEATVHFNLPTSINDFTPDYLLKVTEGIEPADNYAIIGVIFKQKLIEVVTDAAKQRITTAVVPIFIKCGACSTPLANKLEPGDKIIINPTEISRGEHIASSRNKLNLDYVTMCLTKDKKLANDILTSKVYLWNGYSKDNTPFIYLMELKLVPMCDIHGVYKEVASMDNPFWSAETVGITDAQA